MRTCSFIQSNSRLPTGLRRYDDAGQCHTCGLCFDVSSVPYYHNPVQLQSYCLYSDNQETAISLVLLGPPMPTDHLAFAFLSVLWVLGKLPILGDFSCYSGKSCEMMK